MWITFFAENVVAVDRLAMDSITIEIVVLFGMITIFGYHQLRKINLYVHERLRLHVITILHASMINLPDSFKAGAITIWSCRILHQNWFSTNLTTSEACFCMRMPVYEPLFYR